MFMRDAANTASRRKSRKAGERALRYIAVDHLLNTDN
jgi:hypothetical protein